MPIASSSRENRELKLLGFPMKERMGANKLNRGLSVIMTSAILISFGWQRVVYADVTFTDIAGIAGISDENRVVLSASWFDFNSDRQPDIWLSRHIYLKDSDRPSLFVNQGSGRFSDIGENILPDSVVRPFDFHGSSWADFDNDGDSDLFVAGEPMYGAVGGRGTNYFFINQGGGLREAAKGYGIDNPVTWSRQALWYDWNLDGRLDVFVSTSQTSNGRRPSTLFEKSRFPFTDVGAFAGIDGQHISSYFAQSADVTGDGKPDLVIHGNPLEPDAGGMEPSKVYDTSTLPYTDISDRFPRVDRARDVAIADLNNDLHPDIFILRNELDVSKSMGYSASNRRLAGFILRANIEDKSFSLETSGDLSIDFRRRDTMETSRIFIGAGGRHPATLPIRLRAEDKTAAGIMPHTPGSGKAFYVGYDPSTAKWTAVGSGPSRGNAEIWVRAETSSPFTGLQTIGFDETTTEPLSPVLLMWDGARGGYVDGTRAAGLNEPIYGNSVVAGDFDNDGDIDLFIACNDPLRKVPNILYTNRGDGTFSRAPRAGGAAGGLVGPITTNSLEFGTKAAMADFDRNGFPDLLVTNAVWNGQATYPVYSNKLFRNAANGNHWCALRLEGTHSNRDAIGATVYLTSGGKTQMREQSGGMHLFAQDTQVVHFGMGSNSKVDTLRVRWPSGAEQRKFNFECDRYYAIKEW